MDLQLNGKIIVVTGGAKGIGAAIVRACVREAAVPVFLDRDSAAAEKLQAEFAGATKCGWLILDLCSADHCAQAVQQIVKQFGGIDALVNNAGVNDKVGLGNGDPVQYAASLQRNLVHYYSMAHYALPYLKKSKGSIINIGSKTAVTGQGSTSGYASSKGAILALTREWAAELLPYSIRVNAVIPSEVMTPLYRQWLDTFPKPDEKLKDILSKIPLEKRMTTAEEIADMVLFLISPRSSHTTGQHLFVDGGYVHLDRALT